MKAQKAVKLQQQQRTLAWQQPHAAPTKQQNIRPEYHSDTDLHYRDPTLSSSLKALSPRERSLSPHRFDRSFSAPPSPRYTIYPLLYFDFYIYLPKADEALCVTIFCLSPSFCPSPFGLL